MTLTKVHQQKIMLGTMLMFGIIYATNEFLLSPLANDRASLKDEMVKSEPLFREIRGQIARTRGLEIDGPVASATIAQVNAMIPEGAAIAWGPPKIAEFFKSNGVEKATARMTNEIPEKELVGYRRLVWVIEIPNVDFVPFANALAKFENTEPLFECTGFEVLASREQTGAQRVILNVQNLIKL